tara:strand:+ start:298 stop:432 length:135 start_codon:yes stop_codon:yes gene_type:complete
MTAVAARMKLKILFVSVLINKTILKKGLAERDGCFHIIDSLSIA